MFVPCFLQGRSGESGYPYVPLNEVYYIEAMKHKFEDRASMFLSCPAVRYGVTVFKTTIVIVSDLLYFFCGSV